MKDSTGGKQSTLPPGTGALGLKAFLASLSLLFISTLCAYWIVRGQAGYWSEGLPSIPNGLWVSSGILALLSACCEAAARSFARGNGPAFKRLFNAGFILALAFLLSQAMNWSELTAAHLSPTAKSLYSFSFYMLTGLHGLHVVGGVVCHWMAMRTFAAGNGNHDKVRSIAIYWHFLSICWVVLFASLIVGTDHELTGAQIVSACWKITGFAFLMFVLCWVRALAAIVKHEGIAYAVIGLIPFIAFLRAFMRADEMRMRRNLAWWVFWFALALAVGSVGLAIQFGPNPPA